METYILLPVDLRLFDGEFDHNTNTTGDMPVEVKTYYSDYLIDLAEAELVHDQFGQQHPIPKGSGKTIEFRQFDPLPELTTPLQEGVTPDGQSLSVKAITAEIEQYGGYVTLSDMLIWTSIDPQVTQATRAIGSQGGRTIDGITRDILNAGTVVQYADGKVDARGELYYTSADDNCNLTVDAIRKTVRYLEGQDAPKINGYYAGIIHPDVKYDIMSDPDWRKPHEYVDTEHIYRNEIGEIAGVRFVEASRAKIFGGENLAPDSRTLTVNASGGLSAQTTVPFDGGTVAANALVGKRIKIGETVTTVTANTTSQMTVEDAITCVDNAVIYPGDTGAGGEKVYSTLIIADNAYGVTELSGEGMKHILKQLGSAGTADPLDQRATVGWKAAHTAEILIPQYLVRIETTASK